MRLLSPLSIIHSLFYFIFKVKGLGIIGRSTSTWKSFLACNAYCPWRLFRGLFNYPNCIYLELENRAGVEPWLKALILISPTFSNRKGRKPPPSRLAISLCNVTGTLLTFTEVYFAPPTPRTFPCTDWLSLDICLLFRRPRKTAPLSQSRVMLDLCSSFCWGSAKQMECWQPAYLWLPPILSSCRNAFFYLPQRRGGRKSPGGA